MSYTLEHTDIISRFQTLWANQTPVDYPNVGFNIPEKVGDASWVRIRVIDQALPDPTGRGTQLTLGSEQNYHRFAGQITIQVFTVTDIGHGLAMSLAEQAGSIFKNWKSDHGVICRAPLIKEVGKDSEGWFQYNCMIGFIRDELI